MLTALSHTSTSAGQGVCFIEALKTALIWITLLQGRIQTFS